MNKIFVYTFHIIFLILVSAICAQDLRNVKIGIVHSEKTKQLIYPQEQRFLSNSGLGIIFSEQENFIYGN